MRINQNIAAMNAYRNLSVTDGQMSKSLEKLSSGFRINRAADDAAGLSISEGLRSQVGGLKVAVRNAQDGISLVQTAEGALTEVHALLQRSRDLAVQSANTGTTSEEARKAAATEVKQAMSEIDRIGSATEYGGKKLLDGSETAGFRFHVGSGAGTANQVVVGIEAMNSRGLGVSGTGATIAGASTAGTDGVAATTIELTVGDGDGKSNAKTVTIGASTADVRTEAGRETYQEELQAAADSAFGQGVIRAKVEQGTGATDYKVSFETVDTADGTTLAATAANATLGTALGAGTAASAAGTGVAGLIETGDTSAITKLDAAIEKVSTQRANLGAYQNRLEHTIANLSVTQENLAASESRIRDTDMAQEMVSFTRAQILTQAGTSMLAQANQAPQGVLSLLR